MKSGIRDVLLILIAIILGIVVAPYLLKLAGEVIRIVVIIALAYIFFMLMKRFIK